MPTILLTIAYDGTNYSGWQVQPNGITIQQVMEDALENLLGERVQLCSSGRTDAGVHARAMPAAFYTGRELPLRAFIEGTNRYLPDDIAVQDARLVPDGFKPISSAVSKHYRYTIFNSAVRSPLDRLYSWQVRDALDLPAMLAAARYFAGTHDFAAFRASNCVAKTTTRRIDSIEINQAGNFIAINVVGEGFLKYMVRVMSGTLVDVGRGRFKPEHVERLLLEGDRKKAGVTAPACGLCLIKVHYPENIAERAPLISPPRAV
ncbi:MAG: tRNA pseudouridine(38-40) synthase TruA [Geobacteraceae bacterium GWC2_55_20]|nr:MAG: tRNA pseudouridine(38-40) synthase TruA [Geobacteraceae bacterium GWC2_55_20]OGU21948.1 MAG: tRNA pseudouridine(38-40) synthase TruA [Geobacteraceae bacterium GWF2_54_21]HBA72613.1 tRNA pseudouridine(38-40) synthase TruA [Geobacter sp.]HCE67921.1 tRNA pseudouridine(38-40) synthase TruA [Geobacter sp.]